MNIFLYLLVKEKYCYEVMMTKKNETELREKKTKKENGMKNAKTNKLQKIRFFGRNKIEILLGEQT